MFPDRGHLLAARMNAHRQQWDGTICADAQDWNCGAERSFRTDYCANQVPRCFHMHVFDVASPRFIVPEPSVIAAVRAHPELFDDQLLLFYGGRFSEPHGIAAQDFEQVPFGLYRIRRTTIDTWRSLHRLIVEPYPDGWTPLPPTDLRPPALHGIADVRYVKQVRYSSVHALLEQAVEVGEGLHNAPAWGRQRQRRLEQAVDALPRWMQAADDAIVALRARIDAAVDGDRADGQDGREGQHGKDRQDRQDGADRSGEVGSVEGVDARRADADSASAQRADAGPGPADRRDADGSDADRAMGGVAEEGAGEPGRGGADSGSVAPGSVIAVMAAARPAAPPVAAGPDAGEPPVAGAGASADPPAAADPGSGPSQVDRSPALASPDTEPVRVVPEPAAAAVLAARFGPALVEALHVAFATDALVVLTGAPGAGKSWIASHLLDDDEGRADGHGDAAGDAARASAGARTLIVPVAATWRGPDDLLGHVDPASGLFEPTGFTRFACEAEAAWNAGDRRTRLVVFEEFSLSQPEYWMSELLVRLGYGAERHVERTVTLGGSGIAGRPDVPPRFELVPSLCFVATLNADHTVRPLSPRLLDRAALIDVPVTARLALHRAGVAVDDGLAALIDELNDLLAPVGAGFSMRTAHALRRLLVAASGGGAGSGAGAGHPDDALPAVLRRLTPAGALDRVLVQQVLSRVRLEPGEPRDEQLLSRLAEWAARPGSAALVGCTSRIADWTELMRSGRGVFQA